MEFSMSALWLEPGTGQSGRGAKLNRICMAAHSPSARPPPKNVVVASCRCCCCSVPALNWICLMTSCCFLGKQCHSNGRVLSAITVCLTVWQLKVTTISYRYSFLSPGPHSNRISEPRVSFRSFPCTRNSFVWSKHPHKTNAKTHVTQFQ